MNKRDEFDDPKGNDLLGSIGPKAAFFIVLIALSFMIGVVWKLYAGGGDGATGGDVPIVRADTTPYKIIPEDPGGMEMPHKDSTIFSSLNSDPDADRGIENLLADDNEENLTPRSQLFAGLNTERNPDLHAEAQETPLDQPLSEDEERIMSQVKEAQAIVTNLVEGGADAITAADDVATEAVGEEVVEGGKPPENVEPIIAEIKLEPKVEESAEVKPEVVPQEVSKPAPVKQVIAKPKPAPKPKTAAKPVTMGGDYYVQLASVQDSSRTASEWQKLKSKYGSALSGYSYRVETAALSKGTYYRIQAGPVSKSQATTTCNAIKRKAPGGCIVKKK